MTPIHALQINVCPTPDAMAQAAAAGHIIVATGASQLGMLSALGLRRGAANLREHLRLDDAVAGR